MSQDDKALPPNEAGLAKAGADNNVLLLGKKAFISTLIAIALNPLGIAIGYFVGQWLQGPKLSAQFLVIDAQTQSVPINKDLLASIKDVPWQFQYNNEQVEKLNAGNIDAALAKPLLSAAKSRREEWQTYQTSLKSNIQATTNWKPGEDLIVIPIPLEGFGQEAPQTIANRDRHSLLSIYRSLLKVLDSRVERLDLLIKQLNDFLTSDSAQKRTGESIVRVGILNSGDSEGVIYPKATLHFNSSDIILTSRPLENKEGEHQEDTGGYIVIPARSFRKIAFSLDSAATLGGATQQWKKFLSTLTNDEINVTVQTSIGRVVTKGRISQVVTN